MSKPNVQKTFFFRPHEAPFQCPIIKYLCSVELSNVHFNLRRSCELSCPKYFSFTVLKRSSWPWKHFCFSKSDNFQKHTNHKMISLSVSEVYKKICHKCTLKSYWTLTTRFLRSLFSRTVILKVSAPYNSWGRFSSFKKSFEIVDNARCYSQETYLSHFKTTVVLT